MHRYPAVGKIHFRDAGHHFRRTGSAVQRGPFFDYLPDYALFLLTEDVVYVGEILIEGAAVYPRSRGYLLYPYLRYGAFLIQRPEGVRYPLPGGGGYLRLLIHVRPPIVPQKRGNCLLMTIRR
jgi:hypothetical protein